MGREARAFGVGGVLGPAINIKRSPLCGRNFEYYSEDPVLAGELAAGYINGVQSQGVGTSIKHFAANSQEYRRMSASSDMTERTLREIYLPAFETAVKKSQPWTVMCSYNRVNGTYGTARALIGVLPQALRQAQSPQELMQLLNQGGIYFLDMNICAALYRNKNTFPLLTERLEKIQENEQYEALRRDRALSR